MRKISRNSSSGITGVFQNSSGTWNAHITINWERYSLGVYPTKELAAEARRKAEAGEIVPQKGRIRPSARQKNNVSGITGVSWQTFKNKWMAEKYINGEKVPLGVFDNFFDACCARKSADNTMKSDSSVYYQRSSMNRIAIDWLVRPIPGFGSAITTYGARA